MNIKNILEDRLINFEFTKDNIFKIPDVGSFLVVEEKPDGVLTNELELILTEEEFEEEVEFYVFKFGSEWFYTDKDNLEISEFKELRYLGRSVIQDGVCSSFLGVHGGYEILNGSGAYSKWVDKAKFLGIDKLGICERNTLAGVLKFQIACKNGGVKPIIGEQVIVKDNQDYIQFKCYAKNLNGWMNLLKINKSITVDNLGYIDSKDFMSKCRDIFVIIDVKHTDFEKVLPYSLHIKDLYYQVDSVAFSNENTYINYLRNLQKFFSQSQLEPVFFSDAYYLDKDQSKTKTILNTISGVADLRSENQYFKSWLEQIEELEELFSEKPKLLDEIFSKGVENLDYICDACTFEIETAKTHLPEFTLTEDQKKLYGDKENMFWTLIEEGLNEVIKEGDPEKYMDRITTEYNTIKKIDDGRGIDYFLNLWDIKMFCQKEHILMGAGRGSAAGSLVAYAMGLTRLNPFTYGLYFERFLNDGRLGKPTKFAKYIVQTEEGSLEFWEDDIVLIKDNDEEVWVYGKDIKRGDDIIKIG